MENFVTCDLSVRSSWGMLLVGWSYYSWGVIYRLFDEPSFLQSIYTFYRGPLSFWRTQKSNCTDHFGPKDTRRAVRLCHGLWWHGKTHFETTTSLGIVKNRHYWYSRASFWNPRWWCIHFKMLYFSGFFNMSHKLSSPASNRLKWSSKSYVMDSETRESFLYSECWNID